MLLRGIVICCLLACTYSQTTMTVAVSNASINAIATYTFTIVFNSTNRTNYTLTLPPEIIITNQTALTINGISSIYTTSLTNNIIITNRPLNGTVTILISNVKNPPSAIQSHNFLLVTDKDNLGRINTRFIQYLGGTLHACGWSFDGTTEQPNCNLTLTLILSNPIPLGNNNQIVLGYPSIWVNHKTKGLIYQGVTCSISFDHINYQVATCPTAVGGNTLTIYYNLNQNLNASSTLTLRVSGVNCPPTTITPANSAYQVTTTDINGITIDSRSSCPVANVPVTTYTGVFQDTNSQPISLAINSNYVTPQIGFNSATFTTIQAGDTLDITAAVGINSCSNNFYFSRGNTAQWFLFSSSSSVRTYTVSANNIRFTSSIVLSFDCTIVMPASANTVYSTFLFQRSSIPYLMLNAPLTALALPFNNSLSFLSLSSYSMVVPSTYTFSLTTSSPIGPTGQIVFIFPTAITFTSASTKDCSVLMNGLTVLSVTCVALLNPQNMIQVNLNENIVIPSSTSFSVSFPSINNPLSPIEYYFGIGTYYNSSLPQSLVETSLNATSAAYTVYNTVTYLSPASFSVFAQVGLSVTYTSQVILPSSVIFTLVFPPALTSVSFAGNILLKGVSTPTVNPTLSNKVLTFRYDTTIPLNNTVIIPLLAVMPSSIGNYSSIQFSVSDTSGVIYEQSLGSMPIIVNMSSPADFTVSPMGSLVTGVVTMYQFTLVTYIPHAARFILQINIPSDTVFLNKYNATSGLCSGNCYSVINQTSSFFLDLSVNNSGLQSSVMSYTFSLGHFRNPRATGYSMDWIFTTKTTLGVEMESGTAKSNIKLPNILNGTLASGDHYYRGNPNTVNFLLSFSDPIQKGDYILLASSVYGVNPSSIVQCAMIQASCVYKANISTVNTTVIEVTPLVSQIGLTTLEFGVAGLLSSSTTSYNAMNYITVTRFTSAGYSIDSGSILYQIDCGFVSQSNCMSCLKNGSCIDCYSGMYLLGSKCVSNCSSASSFFSVNGLFGSCVQCSTNCNTCIALNSCLSCSNATYFLYDDSVCRLQCDSTGGMIPYSINNINYCSPCPISNCLSCTNRSMNGCTVCTNSTFLQNGACSSTCSDPNSYSNLGSCVSCDVSCIGCTGGGNANCKTCSSVFYKVGVYCLGSCPYGTAPKVVSSLQTCGCDAPCVQCASNSTKYCLTCNVSTALVFNGKCVGNTCPGGSFQLGGQCVSCGSGCGNCSINMCYWCLVGMFQYGNQCVHDCNQLGQQFDSNGTYCILCPTGCDTCDGLTCMSCLPTYSLNGTSCVAICLLLGQCLAPNVIPDKILPLPGLLSLLVWSGLVLVLKLLSQRVYVPYSLLCVVSVIQVILGIVILVDTGTTTTVTRLLLVMDYPWRSTVRVILIIYFVLNYLSNVVYLWLFCKYLKPLVVLPKQIDYIVNGVVLVLATLTNYRFGVLAFSRLFPKPEVMLSNASKLTPVHYICFVSMLLDIMLLACGGLLVYQEIPLTDLFMLGIDILIVVILSGGLTIWMVSAEKPEEYYQGETKKYSTEDRDIAVRENEVTIEDQAYQINDGGSIIKHIIFQDVQNAPLPVVPRHQPIQITSTIVEDNIIDDVFHFESCEDTGNETFQSKLAVRKDGVLERKKKEEAVNFSKEKPIGFGMSQRVGKTERKPSMSMRRVGGKSERNGDRNHLAKRTSAVFESEISDSNDQVIDLDVVIASKIRLSKGDVRAKTREIHQEISPSLFNTQNQRFEIEDYDEAG